MKELRIIGSFVEQLSCEKQYSEKKLAEEVGCSYYQFKLFMNGRLMLTFDQMKKLAECLQVSLDELMKGDESYYNKNVVHCMGEFENMQNCEDILDIIDDYLRLITEQ